MDGGEETAEAHCLTLPVLVLDHGGELMDVERGGSEEAWPLQ